MKEINKGVECSYRRIDTTTINELWRNKEELYRQIDPKKSAQEKNLHTIREFWMETEKKYGVGYPWKLDMLKALAKQGETIGFIEDCRFKSGNKRRSSTS